MLLIRPFRSTLDDRAKLQLLRQRLGQRLRDESFGFEASIEASIYRTDGAAFVCYLFIVDASTGVVRRSLFREGSVSAWAEFVSGLVNDVVVTLTGRRPPRAIEA